MIDIENKVYNDICTATRTQFSGIKFYGEYVALPESFPCVTLVEADNYVHKASIDLDKRENRANVMYECNIFTNGDTKKTDAKKIANFIDNLMANMGFVRTYRSQIPNIDRTIYRIVIRWNGVVEQNGNDFYIFNS